MPLDENHPSVRRLVDKIAKERLQKAMDDFQKELLDGITEETANSSGLAVPDEDDKLAWAEVRGFRNGERHGRRSVLDEIRYRIRRKFGGSNA